ncbi:MAG: hypothetical protein WBL39_13890 [Terrimicrobiaceae bacterium]
MKCTVLRGTNLKERSKSYSRLTISPGAPQCTRPESIHAGLIAARKRGVKLGRPQTVNAHRGDVARLRAQGLTGRTIAKELGIPSSTAFKIIGQL